MRTQAVCKLYVQVKMLVKRWRVSNKYVTFMKAIMQTASGIPSLTWTYENQECNVAEDSTSYIVHSSVSWISRMYTCRNKPYEQVNFSIKRWVMSTENSMFDTYIVAISSLHDKRVVFHWPSWQKSSIPLVPLFFSWTSPCSVLTICRL